jgi:hypothetical protein
MRQPSTPGKGPLPTIAVSGTDVYAVDYNRNSIGFISLHDIQFVWPDRDGWRQIIYIDLDGEPCECWVDLDRLFGALGWGAGQPHNVELAERLGTLRTN